MGTKFYNRKLFQRFVENKYLYKHIWVLILQL